MEPDSSTLTTIWFGSGSGMTSVSSSGTRTWMSFSKSGVTTMKMMSSTSTTSTRGVTLMSELGRPSLMENLRRLARCFPSPRLTVSPGHPA